MPIQLADFTIGWISALEIECIAACELLDEEYENDKAPKINELHNHAIYTYGRIQKHNLVIASLPYSRYGLVSAARVAERMRSSFPALQLLLMVGIAGGAPSLHHDIRLGDVVVSGGVIQYNYGKAIQMREFEERGYPTPPVDVFFNAIGALKALHRRQGHHISKTISHMLRKNQRLRAEYSRPGAVLDRLYKSDYVHRGLLCDCLTLIQDEDGKSQQYLIQRCQRSSEDNDPAIHHGLIASADQLIKDATLRDTLARKHNVLCFETEAAGLMDGPFPCLVIRGISDYADSHKNDNWQEYAAATAASYAKELLNMIPQRKHIVQG